MPVLKPTRGLRLNKSHPLARGLVGCWLMNEGSGDKAFDLSGNGNTGSFGAGAASPTWISGKYGSALSFDGGDYVDTGVKTLLGTSLFADSSQKFSVIVSFKISSGNTGTLIAKASATPANRTFQAYTTGVDNLLVYFRGTNNLVSDIIADGTNHTVFITWDGSTAKYYIDGLYKGTLNVGTANEETSENIILGARTGGTGYKLTGIEDYVLIFNRALTASEIALLYREPFCIFDRGIRPELIGGQIVNLAGTSAALSSLSATAKATRKVSGTVTSISDVEALLNSIRDRLETERNWLREALFNGMTANAFKLGTTLSLGWFWVRIVGCSVLYRGSGMGEIDFVNILAVAESEACEISPPSYISHNSNSTYFYVIRRFNNCGYQEHTLAAAVKVSIDSNGNLAEPQPNNIFSSRVEQVNGNKIQLVWFYCPLAQKSQPVCFNVYYDDRTGQIDYQNPLATIGYKGRKFYSHQTSALEAGKYLFAIRPEDAGDIENSSLARLRIQLDTLNPDAIDILRAEAV